MFTVDNLITDCKKAVAGGRTAQAEVRDILAKAVSAPGQVLNELGEPETGGVAKIYDSEELTIINVVWGPHMTIMPHNHEMWANIGIYTGREDNIFWRRVADAEDGYIEAAGAELFNSSRYRAARMAFSNPEGFVKEAASHEWAQAPHCADCEWSQGPDSANADRSAVMDFLIDYGGETVSHDVMRDLSWW